MTTDGVDSLDDLLPRSTTSLHLTDRRTNSYTITRRGRREIGARSDWEEQYVAV